MKRLFIRIHILLYPLLSFVFKLIGAHKFVCLNEIPTFNGNAIFAVNHSCKYDIPYTCQLIKRQSYVLVGKQPLEWVDRVAFCLNGTVWVDRKDRQDKKRAFADMLELLKHGANMVIFPEGTWNLTPSKPMLPLYWGVIDLSRKSGRPIIPIVLEYSKNTCYAAFGNPIFVSKTDSKQQRISDLTDHFASLKWSLWEHYPDIGFDSLEDWNSEEIKRVKDYPKLDIDYERSVIRQEHSSPEEVFLHLYLINPNINNAFLLNKRWI